MAIVQLLLNNANVDARDNDGRTALSLAAAAGHVAIVRLLLNKRADVELVDKFNRTPLSWAAGKGNSLFKYVDLGIAKYRISAVILRNHLATLDRHLAVVGLLLAEGA
jgi:ankyrin repeat protein